jgi:ubiquitin-protein ligase
VYVNNGNVSEWKAFITGPDDSPYAGKTWYILITFPKDYPAETPLFRFMTIPHHINVSAEGLICMPLLCQLYTPYVSVLKLLIAIYDLLIEPQREFAIDVGKFWDFVTDPDGLNRAAVESKRVAFDGDYLRGVTIRDEAAPEPVPDIVPIDESGFEEFRGMDEVAMSALGDEDLI